MMWQRLEREQRLTCEQLRVQLPAYFDGELPADRQGTIREHLATCDACACYVREARALEADLVAVAQRRVRHVKLSPQTSACVQERVYRRMRRAVMMQRVTRFAVRALPLVALMAFVLWTPAARVVARVVEQFIGELGWSNTSVKQVPPDYEPEITLEDREWHAAQLAAGRAWHFSFEGHNFGGCCSTEEPMRNQVVSLPQAIKEAGFELRLPTFIPDGFELSEIRLLGVAPYGVFMIYEGKDARLGFYQSSVGVISQDRPSENTVTVESRATSIVTDGTVEQVTVGAIQAALLEGEFLVWEEDGINFHVIGPGLDVETLIRIAESLTPARQQ